VVQDSVAYSRSDSDDRGFTSSCRVNVFSVKEYYMKFRGIAETGYPVLRQRRVQYPPVLEIYLFKQRATQSLNDCPLHLILQMFGVDDRSTLKGNHHT